MVWLERLLHYFIDDPLRLLTVLGGSGGLVYWYDRLRNRPRLRAKLIREDLLGDPASASIEVEVLNLGDAPTSLEPAIRLTAYTPKRRRRRLEFAVESADRYLPPHTPRRIQAVAAATAVLPFLWFKTYRLRSSRGGGARLRIRALEHTELPFGTFLRELIWFLVFGRTSASVPTHGRLE